MVEMVRGANEGNCSAASQKGWRSSAWRLPCQPAGDATPLRERISAAVCGGAAALTNLSRLGQHRPFSTVCGVRVVG